MKFEDMTVLAAITCLAINEATLITSFVRVIFLSS